MLKPGPAGVLLKFGHQGSREKRKEAQAILQPALRLSFILQWPERSFCAAH